MTVTVEPAEPASTGARPKISLTGTQETLLMTLDCRRRDALGARPILNDTWAVETAAQIDYDLSRLRVQQSFIASISLRARWMDRWTAQFLASHEEATVLHLACGLDARALRISSSWRDNPRVRWIDVDVPDVVELRKQLLPNPTGDYSLVAASVLDTEWLAAVPTDRPVVVVMEGLTMYLSPEQGHALIARLCTHFRSGNGNELVFDTSGWIMIAMQRVFAWVRTTGAQFRWSVDDPRAIEDLHPGLKLVEEQINTDLKGVEEFPTQARMAFWLWAHLPGFRYLGRLLRYEW